VPTISATDHGPVRLLSIDNEAKCNAFSGDMAPTLRRLLVAADDDPAVRCIVITGTGTQAFSSGHDLHEVLEHPETAGDRAANEAFTTAPELGTPVIAAVNGAAYAAGFILALNCDVRIAGDNAQFCAVGARIGLVPVGGQLSRLLSVVSYPVAFTMLATAEPIDAEEALRVQFVTQVCDRSETVDRALGLAQVISTASPAVIRAIKTGLRATLRDGLHTGMAAESALARVIRSLPDGDEGVRSFLQKRPAQYPDAPLDLQVGLDAAIQEVMAPAAIAATPAPPYTAVIFTSVLTDEDEQGYAVMAATMDDLARQQPGFLGVDTARAHVGITVSYWVDDEAARAWKRQAEHLVAQRRGQQVWYSEYRVRVATVHRDYTGPPAR